MSIFSIQSMDCYANTLHFDSKCENEDHDHTVIVNVSLAINGKRFNFEVPDESLLQFLQTCGECEVIKSDI